MSKYTLSKVYTTSTCALNQLINRKIGKLLKNWESELYSVKNLLKQKLSDISAWIFLMMRNLKDSIFYTLSKFYMSTSQDFAHFTSIGAIQQMLQ